MGFLSILPAVLVICATARELDPLKKEGVLGKCTNRKGELVDVGGDDQCDGYCMAPIFDKLEAVPIFGNIMKNAREDLCEAVKITSADFNSCKDRNRNLKVLGSKDGSTKEKICFGMSMLLGLSGDACVKVIDCFSAQDSGKCVAAMGDWLKEVFEDRKRDLKNMSELSLLAYESLGFISPHKTLVCPLTVKDPIGELLELVKAVKLLVKELPKALYHVAKLMWTNKCRASILMGLTLDIQLGPTVKGEELGIYFDISEGTWAKLATRGRDYAEELVKGIFSDDNDVTVGFYSSSTVKMTTGLGAEVETGKAFATLLGGPDLWEGYGYSMKFEAGIPNVIAGFGAAMEFELVFSARGEDKQFNNLIGWKLHTKLEGGPEATPLSAEVGCGFANAALFDPKEMVSKCGNNMKTFQSEMKRIGQGFIEASKKNFNVKRDIMEEVAECAAAVECLTDQCKDAWEHYSKMPEKVFRKCSNNFAYVDECHSFKKKCDGEFKDIKTPNCLRCKEKETTSKCLSCKKHSCSRRKVPKTCKVAKSCKQPLTCKKPKTCNKPKTCKKAKSCKIKKDCKWYAPWRCIWSFVVDGGKCGWDTITNGAECGWNKITSGTECGWNYIKSGTECGWNVVKDGAKCGWDQVKDGAKCGWDFVTDCVWEPIMDYSCQGADFTCEKFEQAWVKTQNKVCKGANYVCEAFESVTKCIGHLFVDTKECVEWVSRNTNKCTGDLIEVISKDDGGKLAKCAHGVDKCTTVIPDFIKDRFHKKQGRRLMGYHLE